MEDKELQELMLKKKKLIKQVCKTRDDLKEAEINENNTSMLRHQTDNLSGSTAQLSNRTLKKLVEASGHVLGVDFIDGKKSWLRDNKYLFEVVVVAKALRFALDLIVDVTNEKDFVIEDITCHFHDIEACLIQECTPWIQRFTKVKNLSFLITAVVYYSEHSRLRAKILSALEEKKYVTLNGNIENVGGYFVFVHSPSNEDDILFRFTWATHFVDRSWSVENFFRIEVINAGPQLLNASKAIIDKFCQEKNFEKEELELLWSQLCKVIDENQN